MNSMNYKSVSAFFLSLLLVIPFLAGCSSTPKPEQNYQVIYQEQTLSFGDTKSEIEALIGEGTTVAQDTYTEDEQPHPYYQTVEYSGLSIQYYSDTGFDDDMICFRFSISSPDVYTFLGVNVGATTKQLEKACKYARDIEDGDFYVLYYQDGIAYGSYLGLKNIESNYEYNYDKENVITSIRITN